MTIYDWIVIFIYLSVVVGISYIIGKKQKNQEDYYIAGKTLKYWQVGSSLVANQVSAISLVGVPAFIAIKRGGGLKWLQYEFAVPLAMIVIILVLIPVYRKKLKISIYEYLEQRFGSFSRSLLSFVFLISRSLASGVALLATSYVTSVALNLDIKITIILTAFVSLLYTSVGGIKADIYSDIIQLIILWISSIISIYVLLNLLSWDFSGVHTLSVDRLKVFYFTKTGLGDGENFGFFPMLFGGLFLYISYYGCDQSQAQRLLSTKNDMETKKALVFNSFLRFPLVLTYSAVGVLFLLFLKKDSSFAFKLSNLSPDYAMPLFFKTYLPAGVLGIVVSGIFAASMSSLDSAINSLSAATWEDFLIKLFPSLERIKDGKKVFYSRFITILWGVFTSMFALMIVNSSETVVEIVNKIGSAFYGPIAAFFFIGIFTKAKEFETLMGFAFAIMVNIFLWIRHPEVSWLWWNLTGFFIPFLIIFIIKGTRQKLNRKVRFVFNERFVLFLWGWFLFIIFICFVIEKFIIY